MNKIITATCLFVSTFSLSACGESDPDIVKIQDTKPGFMMGKTYKEGFEDWRICDSVTWEKIQEDVTGMYKGQEVIRATCDVANIEDYNKTLKTSLLKVIQNTQDKEKKTHELELADKVTSLKSIKLSLYFKIPTNQKPQPYIYANRYEWKDGKTGLLTVRPQAIVRDMENQRTNFTEVSFGTNSINSSQARAMATLYSSMRKDN
ncbi:hypothetical protein EBP22_17575 [Salmonella enterica subsp. enterica serovar Typhimurium]|nr:MULTISPECIES: hypothetical protein [Citrobacter freundii complex]EBZ5074393.1 hypothetical protein [Salmonella enterica subsp. enterica serovar Typhimurium]EEB8458224.1 hypothetical protein [Salmonella enterica]ECL7522363.1 hypothetical protein [Salmonella enterica subsp. enterica serovar Typhimurium]EDN3714066.1 hypothetical protein [Salmonella enterica subsp. enterica serovar Typhimurium]EEF6236492.1 hypothetical protein [Salmonella enterica]